MKSNKCFNGWVEDVPEYLKGKQSRVWIKGNLRLCFFIEKDITTDSDIKGSGHNLFLRDTIKQRVYYDKNFERYEEAYGMMFQIMSDM